VGERLYVYALLEGTIRTPKARRLQLVDIDGVFAVVERRAVGPELTEQTLREQHRLVVALTTEADAILPVRFGTLVDREELDRVVRSHAPLLREALRQVRGREQMTVRVFGESAAPVAPQAAASGTEYLQARAKLTRPALTGIALRISTAVQPIVHAERSEAGQRGIQVTLNHLIDRGESSRYRAAVEKAVGSAESRSVVISGPWPPFAFAPDLWSAEASPDRLSS